ncbi:MAG: hypothetical protein DI535_04900 [Citrobacter freundii]|nr:MAG: hypothetical protein DI535_04900 [Citrobacter freundii]
MKEDINPLDFLQKGAQQNALLAAIVHSSQDAIVSKTVEGIVLSWNRAAEQLFEYTASEMIGHSITRLIPEDRMNEEQMIIEEMLSGRSVEHYATIRRTKSGRLVSVSLSISPVLDERQQTIGIAKIARDITRQQELEAQLKATNLELQKSNLYKDDFIALAGHELKTPLSTIKAYLELIDCYPDRSAEFSDKALRQVQRLQHLLSELLDLTRLQAGKLTIQRAMVSMEEIIHNAMESVQQSMSTHQLYFQSELAALQTEVDAVRIEQVLVNLLTNAIKYSPGADSIVIRAFLEGSSVHVSVTDFGIGIAPQHQTAIFQRFYRVSGSTHITEGLGMGLHIARHIIDQHKGKLWLESVPGEGSTFHFTLPLPQI